MKKETTALTILDTLFKWRKLGIIIVAGTAIAVTGELTGLASKPEVAPVPSPAAEVAPAPVTTVDYDAVARQQLEREAAEALDRYNNPHRHCSAVAGRCW